MNAVMVAEEIGPALPLERNSGGHDPRVTHKLMNPSREPARREAALNERFAQTPLVPLAWIRGETRVHPEDAGERKAGRPKLNVRNSLSVGDLDLSVTYIQRRTRDLQKLVRGAQPNEEHTTKAVKAAIKDAIRRLSQNLPEPHRDAIDHAVAGL